MNNNSNILRCIAFFLILAGGQAAAGEWSGYLEAQGRYFTQEALSPEQGDQTLSLAFEPEYYHAWEERQQSLIFRPFLRWDSQDQERSHADIRELSWSLNGDEWWLLAGIGKVFWGVTEALHLVDIINQTDLVENPDGEQKLGQPMLKLSFEKAWGVLDLFALPGFRERTFPGAEGRLRTRLRVDSDLASYESARQERRLDLAIRWSKTLGDWDIGLAHFNGTNRSPSFTPAVNDNGELVLAPHYEIIRQTSLDLQATKGDWLWKLEALHRSGQFERYNAATAGFEHTFVGILDSDMDLGLLLELMYDQRQDEAPVPFENDLFLGLRLTANDAAGTELLTGVIKDLDSSSWMFNLETSRRLGAGWKAAAQARFWLAVEETDPFFDFHQDDYLELTLTRYF